MVHNQNNPYIFVNSGVFYIMQPEQELKDKRFILKDQVLALQKQCRYLGHIGSFWSVLHHELVLSVLMEKLGYKHLALPALLHDNAEAYLGDIVYPLKRLPEFRWYKELEARYNRCIEEWQGLPKEILDDPLLMRLDRELALYEREALSPNANFDLWDDKPQSTLDTKTKHDLVSYIEKLSRYSFMTLEIVYYKQFEQLQKTKPETL